MKSNRDYDRVKLERDSLQAALDGKLVSLKDGDILFVDRDRCDLTALSSAKVSEDAPGVLIIPIVPRNGQSVAFAVHQMSAEEWQALVAQLPAKPHGFNLDGGQ